MQNNKTLFILLSLILPFGLIKAQHSSIEKGHSKSEKIIAKNIHMDEQLRAIDSLITTTGEDSTLDLFGDDDEYPAEYIYTEEWDNKTLNPYKISVVSLSDSFIVNCSDFYPPTENIVTSEYGRRWSRFHAGIDIRVNVGDSIRSAFDGKVRIARTGSKKKGYGYFVLIRHNNGLETLYGHLSKILVTANQTVKAGEVIALGGNTGRSTGPHLHFETRFLGNAFNPRTFIDFDKFVVYSDKYTITKNKTFKELNQYVNSPARYYTVKSGDTLGKIAQRHHTSIAKLCKLNGLKTTSTLRLGKRLRID